MNKDFWLKSKVVVIGGGNFGTVLATLAANNSEEVRVWVRDESDARQIRSNHLHPGLSKDVELPRNVTAYSQLERIFESKVNAVIWALPSQVCREQAKVLAKFLRGDEVILHATKGIEEHSMKRISQILKEELPCARIGVISGPNLAAEIIKNEPAATVVASRFREVIDTGAYLLSSPTFRVYGSADVPGVEWSGALKNIYAIACGALNGMGFGVNTQSMLIARSLAEMVRFGVTMGGQDPTFRGLAGVGDLVATCVSPLSRNFRVGQALSQGKTLQEAIAALGSVAEGVRTTELIVPFAKERKIEMPVAFGVFEMLQGQQPRDVLEKLMLKPKREDVEIF